MSSPQEHIYEEKYKKKKNKKYELAKELIEVEIKLLELSLKFDYGQGLKLKKAANFIDDVKKSLKKNQYISDT